MAAQSADSSKPLAEMEVGDIPRHCLVGNIALVSHFFEVEKVADLYPSAAFADWQIRGAKVDRHADQVFSPVDTHARMRPFFWAINSTKATAASV